MSDNIKIVPIITIVCDDVRMEGNGKPFLVGIYTGNAQFGGVIPPDADELHNWPIFLWMPFKADSAGIASFEVKIIGPDPKHIVQAKGKVLIGGKPAPTEITPLVMGPFHLKIWQDGEVKILFKHEDESEFQTLRIIPVTFKVEQPPESGLMTSSTLIAPPS